MIAMAAAMEDAFFGEDTNQQTTDAIKAWVMNEINMRMNLAGHAVDFMNHLDTEQQRVVQHADEQVERVNVIVNDINTTKGQITTLFGVIEEKMKENDQKLLTVPELTDKLAEKTEQIATLFTETQKFAVKSEQDLVALNQKTADFANKITVDLESAKVVLLAETTKLRDDIVIWSDGYVLRVETMVKSGDFKFERGSSAPKAKFDKKEVSVWQIPAGVSKPDFRHWADSIDIQLEAVHGFVFPDLVLEKVKRLTSEVTEAALMQIIKNIKDEHKVKEGAKQLAAQGLPPGLPGGLDPWATGRLAGSGCADLIDPASWEFTDKTRWLYTYS